MKQLLVLFFFCGLFAQAQTTTASYQRAKIFFDKSHSHQALSNLGVAADHGRLKVDRFLISDFSSDEIALAKKNGYKVEIIIEDIKAHYKDASRNTTQRRNPTCEATGASFTTPGNFNQGSMGGYLTYQEALNELDDMVRQYPNLITSKAPISDFLTEGQTDNSVTPSIGSNPIYWFKISDNPNSDETEPEILYTSLHHAREPMSLMQMIYYMWYLLENYEDDAEVSAIVDNTELYFVPVVNPDGYLYNEVTDPSGGGLWRKNRGNGNGVDNNRNYDYHINGDATNGSWGGPGSSSNPSADTYHGTGPFSESENQAIKWFVEQHEFVIALNNHTFGELIYYPFGYADVATPDDAIYQNLLGEITSQNNYRFQRDSPFAGDSDDFMYGTVGTHDKIFAFTPEIGTSFWPAASEIENTCRDMLFLNLRAAQIALNFGLVSETSPSYIGPGTSFSSSFDVRSLSLENASNYTVTLQPISSNIVSQGPPVALNSLNPFETKAGTITYTLDTDVEDKDLVEFDLVLNNGLFDKTVRVSKIYGSPKVLLEDAAGDLSNFEETAWNTTSSTFVSSSSSITDSPSGNYANGEDSSIILGTALDLTNATIAAVSYYAKWDIEDTWDFVQFEISKDNGTTWEPQCGNFTSAGTNNQPIGEPLYDGVQNDWILENIDLSDYLGERIIARFRLVSDTGTTKDGFYFDDLKFIAFNEDNLGVNTNTLSQAFTVFPNPVSNILTIKTALGSYKTSIFNTLGQQIMTTQSHQGNTTLDYTSLPSGLYFMRVENQTEGVVYKIIKE